MSDRREDDGFKDLCSQLLESYMFLASREAGNDVRVRGGGGGGKPADTSSSTSSLPQQDIAQGLIQHEPTGASSVPTHLPEDLRDNPEDITQERLLDLYNIDSAVQDVNTGTLSMIDLITLHLRSYRNILDVQLSDVEGLRVRLYGYFRTVFMRLMERCFQDRLNNETVVST